MVDNVKKTSSKMDLNVGDRRGFFVGKTYVRFTTMNTFRKTKMNTFRKTKQPFSSGVPGNGRSIRCLINCGYLGMTIAKRLYCFIAYGNLIASTVLSSCPYTSISSLNTNCSSGNVTFTYLL